MQGVLMLISKHSGFSFNMSENMSTVCVWNQWDMVMHNMLLFRVGQGVPLRWWDEVGLLSVPLPSWIAPLASVFRCSCVHGLRCTPFDEKMNFAVKPNCLTAYPFMSSILWATVALVILIILINFLFIKNKILIIWIFWWYVIWYTSYGTQKLKTT